MVVFSNEFDEAYRIFLYSVLQEFCFVENIARPSWPEVIK